MKKSRLKQPKSLRHVQVLLWNLITAPESVEKQLSQESGFNLPIMESDQLSAVKRLDIYANMYFFRIKDALSQDFPGLHQLLGEDRFHNMVTDYLIEYPSKHYSLRYIGQHLPLFLSKYKPTKKIRFLPDLALFEWNLLYAFDAEDTEVLTFDHLRLIDPQCWNELFIKTVNAFQLITLRYPVWEWRKNILNKERMPQNVRAKKQSLIIWRKGYQILYRTIKPAENNLLREALKGTLFGNICKLTARDKKIKNAAYFVAGYFQGWVRDGLLASKG